MSLSMVGLVLLVVLGVGLAVALSALVIYLIQRSTRSEREKLPTDRPESPPPPRRPA